MPRKPNDGKTPSKASCYRDAATKLGADADLDNGQKHIQDNFGIFMEKNQISQYRSLENNRVKSGKKKKKPGRKPKMAVEGAVNEPVKSTVKEDPILQFVGIVRGWEDKMGAINVKKVFNALYKS